MLFFIAEILDAARNDIINALVSELTSVMNEQRQNELRQLRTPEEETDDMENENSNEVYFLILF